jgi:hypothetical protein
MIWRILEDYFVVFSVGLILGLLIARYYYERVSNHSLGRIIEGVVISESVEDLQGYSRELESLLLKMRSEADNLLDQVKRFRDIERMLGDSESLDDDIKHMSTGNLEKSLENE